MSTEIVEKIRKYIQDNTSIYSQRGIYQMLQDAGYEEEDIQEAFKQEAKRLELSRSREPAITLFQVVLALIFLFAVLFICQSAVGTGGCRYS